ncbi:MAG: hypothetical protein H0T53_11460 [Herpetosiphonaceae bacterium]|nr:hypothetical protein [Herpetosiphonaceae bacterium]
MGNTHLTTTRLVEGYFETEYDFKLPLNDQDNTTAAWYLSQDRHSITYTAAIVRMLADYRFGNSGNPNKVSHADVTMWTLADALAISSPSTLRASP